MGAWVRGRVGLVAEVVVGGEEESRDGVGVLWRCVDVWTGCQGSANIHQKGKVFGKYTPDLTVGTDRSQGCEQLTGGVR